MNAHHEGSSIMAEDSHQNHANKQSQPFQPGSPSKRNNNTTNNSNNNDDHLLNISSPNSNQRRKRKQPRSLSRQKQQISQNEKDINKQENNNDDKQPKNTNINTINNWKFNFDENRKPSNAKQIPTPSFGKFFESITANSSPKHKDNEADNDDSTLNNKHPPFIEVFDEDYKQKVIDLYTEQLSGIFDELDLEICETQLQQYEKSAASPVMLKYNEYNEYNQYAESPNKKKEHSNIDESAESPNSFYVHANGHKISDESFKLMQRCLNGLEKAKHVTKRSAAMQELTDIQQNIYKTMKVKHGIGDNHSENNSEEKMSVDAVSVSRSPYVQSPQQHSKQSRSHRSYHKQKQRQTPMKTHIRKGDNNNTITNNINFISNHHANNDIRRQLSFSSAKHDDNKVNDANDLLQYNHLSSPQIIAKQHQKLVRTNQEINDLHYELNCVYNTLNAVQKNRNKLFEDIKSIRKENTEQIKSIVRQYTQFKQQANLYQKEKQEIEYDLQTQNNYNNIQEQPLSSIKVSPAKIPNKSPRKRRHHYKR